MFSRKKEELLPLDKQTFFWLESKAFLRVARIRFSALTQNQTALWALLLLNKAIDCSTLLSGLSPQSRHRHAPTLSRDARKGHLFQELGPNRAGDPEKGPR